ncbi:hypothetical protein ABPG72_006537 [Tetrahymena utriculariae]
MSYQFDLQMRCPSHDYDGGEIIGESCRRIIQWHHKNCGGKSQVYDDISLKCASCSRKDHIKNWKFYCTKQNDYFYIQSIAFADAVTAFSNAQTDPKLSLQMKQKINSFVGKLYANGW